MCLSVRRSDGTTCSAFNGDIVDACKAPDAEEKETFVQDTSNKRTDDVANAARSCKKIQDGTRTVLLISLHFNCLVKAGFNDIYISCIILMSTVIKLQLKSNNFAHLAK